MADTKLPRARFARTVLIVDAFKEDREYWAQRLHISSPNYVVLEADSGAAALAVCQSQRVDCVILEMNLPDMAGFGLLIKLVGNVCHPEIAVIMLSRVDLAPIAELATDNGAQAFLVKSRASGDQLNMVIHHAIATVARSNARNLKQGVPSSIL
jgi:DNA-binding NarL/FixJ family response regulator